MTGIYIYFTVVKINEFKTELASLLFVVASDPILEDI